MSVSMEKNRAHARLKVVQGIKKKKHAQGRGGGRRQGNEGNLIPRIWRVWNHREQDTTDRKYMCCRPKKMKQRQSRNMALSTVRE